MNINQSIITLMILVTVSSITIGCASKLTEEQALAKSQLTEEQALAESQALSDRIKNTGFSASLNLSKFDLPATKRVGNKNLRLVLLSRRASLRWLGEAGFKFHKSDHGTSSYRRTGNSTSRGYRSHVGYFRGDDPQYIYFNNSPVVITGSVYLRYPKTGEEIIYIFDQFNDIRVVTYDQY